MAEPAREATTAELLKAEDSRRLFHPLAAILEHRQAGPTIFVRGEGIYLTDIDGNRYIDGLAGLWNVNIGHGQPAVREAVAAQMAELEYAPSFFGFSSVPAIELAKMLGELAPSGMTRVFYTNSGSEAVETAIKLARFLQRVRGFSDRYKVISRLKGYHGATIATMSATGLENYWKMVGPLVPGFVHIPPPNCYRCPWGKEPDSCHRECADALEEKILSEGPETVAAFIAEPVMATGGVIVSPDGYVQKVREICDRHGVLYIDDEVVCGLGRTGELFGVDHWQTVPDMITSAKGISSAYLPLGATLIREALYEELVAYAERQGDAKFFHGFTTGGHPTVCAAALANLRIITGEDLVDRARRVGAHLQARLQGLRDLPLVGDVRGKGLIAAVELVRDRTTRECFDAAMGVGPAVTMETFRHGLICRAVGGSDIIALSPPLVITEAEVDRMVSILRDAIEAVAARVGHGQRG